MRERDQAHSLSCASRLAKSVYVWQPTRHLREERCKREGEDEESQLEEEAAQESAWTRRRARTHLNMAQTLSCSGS